MLLVEDEVFLGFLFEGMRGGIAGWKLPTRLLFLDSLPRTSVGKVDYCRIRCLFF